MKMPSWLQRNLRLVWLGVLAELRNPAIRLFGILGAAGVAVYAWNQGALAPSLSVVLTEWIGRGYGVAACLWFAYAAIRDLKDHHGAVLRSKPVDGGAWVLVNWASGLCVWLVLLALAFLGAMAAQLPAAGTASVMSHGLGFLRAALVVGAMGTVSFALSRMMRSPLGGILVMFAWFCAMAGLQFIPTYLLPDFSQNVPVFVALGAGLLCVAGFLVERFRRGELRRPAPALGALLLLTSLVGVTAARAYTAAPAMDGYVPTVWDQIARQYVEVGGRLPGFWLPDGKGGMVRTYDHRGKILLLYIFAADDMDSARTLPALEAIAREYDDRGVQPIGVCLSPDHGDGWSLIRGGGYRFPIGIDVSTLKTSAPPQSAVARAYNASTLPMLVVADRQRRVRHAISKSSYEDVDLRMHVEELLREEGR
jgi:hypothetical protein